MATDYVRDLEGILAEPLDVAIDRERLTLPRLLAASVGRVVLFGAGGLGTQTLTCLRGSGIEPLAFSDNNPALWGTSVSGVEVLPPLEAAARYGADSLFVVTIWNPSHWYAETRQTLETSGCRLIAPPSPVYWHFHRELLPFYVQDLPHNALQQADRIRAAAGLWCDDESREEYLRQIAWRIGGAWTFSRPKDSEIYFLSGVFDLRDDEVLVDCGAFDGDTLRAFMSRWRTFRQFVALEPDPDSFQCLTDFVSTLPMPVRARVKTLQCAVGAERTQIRFAAGFGVGSRQSNDGSWLVPSLPIADLPDLCRPVTLIKMDIEGSEHDALVGARSLIEVDRPVLAICLEHSQAQLWDIPLLMREMGPHYLMYLRSHEGDGWQTVAYAVPQTRAVRGKQ